ncbi:MAG TPA: glycoside hydrolase family 97 protein [Bacteroidales bacterium]|nr:MAG: Retaining alpha-galactosidase precursor [Bacteroidetes bacterium ADurb.Bin037]HPV87876.1 glycoside hydrolase family 97 protein [Bacteroidales bacterium]HPW78078.1 glycoside hydrolase family 97 protein [Bacteroidales bacterium]HQB56582.1 glycoside hydrolase family 97 protein [Bacteroidales bacterium]
MTLKSTLRFVLLCIWLTGFFAGPTQAKVKVHSVSSPDGRLELQVVTQTGISFCLLHKGNVLVSSPALSMSLKDGTVLGPGARLISTKRTHVNDKIPSPLYRKSIIQTRYNQLDFRFREGFGIRFRIYDQGAAYQFYTTCKDSLYIVAETAGFIFPKDYTSYIPYSRGEKNPFHNSFENVYTVSSISEFNREKLAFLPLLVCLDNDLKMVITESDLESYPGMYLRGGKTSEGFAYEGVFAPIPSGTRIDRVRGQVIPTGYSKLLARTAGERSFPWRIMAVAEKDTELPVNDLVYALGSPNRIGSADWIKPGKVAWDWWNNWGITGVDFRAGINTKTYKYFIDFAAANDIEYVVLDEGWSPPSGGDIMKVIPEIDLEELVSYANRKQVGLILWCVGYVLDEKLEEACRKYSRMGFKGFKVDFMDRDDQPVVEMLYRIAKVASRHKLLINLHGMYKPTGLNRTYPNIVNFEGVFGLEQSKWSREDLIPYDVTFPYIRMLAGPVDYTQGGLRNATRQDFHPVYNNPMAAGTRAHQVATYIVFDNPLVMLCDNPTSYTKEQETTDFITDIPTVWDETQILQGELGKYIVSARRSGERWFVGGLTDWTSRTITLDLSFLEPGRIYKARMFMDGVNADRYATDYKIEEREVTAADKLTFELSPGGGFAISF